MNWRNATRKCSDKLIITVELSKCVGKSSSGKSIIIASSEGNQALPGAEEIKIGLNVYMVRQASFVISGEVKVLTG